MKATITPQTKHVTFAATPIDPQIQSYSQQFTDWLRSSYAQNAVITEGLKQFFAIEETGDAFWQSLQEKFSCYAQDHRRELVKRSPVDILKDIIPSPVLEAHAQQALSYGKDFFLQYVNKDVPEQDRPLDANLRQFWAGVTRPTSAVYRKKNAWSRPCDDRGWNKRIFLYT